MNSTTDISQTPKQPLWKAKAGSPAFLLAGLLVVLITIAYVGIRPSHLPAGPEIGEPLPDFPVRVNGETDAVFLSDVLMATGCSLLVVVSTQCPVCTRMRVTWPARFMAWTDSLNLTIKPMWLVTEGTQDWEAFIEGFDLTLVEAIFPAEDPDALIDGLGVVGTPTAYVVDAKGNFVYGLLGDRLPPSDAVRHACP